MKKFYFSTILSAIVLLASAQPKNDPAAKAILDAVSAKFKTFTTIQATFSYKVENGSGKALSNKTGSIMMKGTKYKVSFSGQEIYCDGTTVWNYHSPKIIYQFLRQRFFISIERRKEIRQQNITGN
jgi:outer membrane lipoprotein-sorting protein